MRAFLVVALIGCGGGAPAKSAAPAAPAPEVAAAPAPPTTAMAAPMPMSSDPQEGGEVTQSAAKPGFASLTGVGSGEMPADAEPAPIVSGDIDKAIIKRVVKKRNKQYAACYEKALKAKPTLEGTTTVKFTIAESGHVIEAAGSGLDPDVDTCVANEFKQLEFPKAHGGNVIVSYPIRFKQQK